MSGVEAAELIVAFLPSCKVVLITGQGLLANEFLHAARGRGHDFLLLEKPIHPAELLARVDKVLEQPKRRGAPVILNVDDSDIQRYAVTRLLQTAGYVVQEAATGEEAIRLAHSRPDLIILDISLPDIDGFEVCRRLKSDQKTSAIPIVHLTNIYKDESSRRRSLQLGTADYLMHPVRSEELVRRLQSVLRRKSAAAGGTP